MASDEAGGRLVDCLADVGGLGPDDDVFEPEATEAYNFSQVGVDLDHVPDLTVGNPE